MKKKMVNKKGVTLKFIELDEDAGEQECDYCKGSGFGKNSNEYTCPKCKGIGVNKDNDNLEIIKRSDKTKLSVEESLYLVSTILSNTVFGKDPMMRLFSEGMKKEIIDKCDEIITKYTNRTKTSGENNGIDRV